MSVNGDTAIVRLAGRERLAVVPSGGRTGLSAGAVACRGELVLATGAAPRRLDSQPEHPRVVTFHVLDDVPPLKRALARGEVPMGVPGWRRGIEAAWAEIQDRLRIAPAPARTGS